MKGRYKKKLNENEMEAKGDRKGMEVSVKLGFPRKEYYPHHPVTAEAIDFHHWLVLVRTEKSLDPITMKTYSLSSTNNQCKNFYTNQKFL